MTTPEPMIKLEPGGRAPILSYNVPEPTSYSGKNLIELTLPEDAFVKLPVAASPPPPVAAGTDHAAITDGVTSALRKGFFDAKVFPALSGQTGRALLANSRLSTVATVANADVQPATMIQSIPVGEFTSQLLAGNRPAIYKSLYGANRVAFVPTQKQRRPRLHLVETYRLSSFLGAYGAGRTIKTFSLLPGEKTKIGVKSYLKTETEAKQASSVLDSFTEESADDFETTVASENSDRKASSESFEYHAEADAHASWGWGSANVSGGVKGGSNSSREEFGKNVASATQKHAAKASAKRDVQINTSYSSKTEAGQETAIEREIQNVNVSRTLNFVFRQMNQEFITLLHLVDVRVGYFDGTRESVIEVGLPDLDSLLAKVIVPAQRESVRKIIVNELTAITDYRDNLVSFVEERKLPDADGVLKPGYLRVRKDFVSTYKDEPTQTSIDVPGIILAASKYTLRTEGVIVDSILGAGDALDSYSHGLQDEVVRAKKLANDLTEAQIGREKLGQTIAADKDAEGANAFHTVYCCEEDSHKDDVKP